MARILITGSAGLIGRELTKKLRSLEHEIVEYDVSDDAGSPKDIRNFEELLASLKNCQGIVNLAAISRVTLAQSEPQLTWSTNVAGTVNVVNAALSIPSNKRPWVIHASSREVYGNQPHSPVVEDTIFSPINVYGRSKASSEHIATSAKDAGVNVSVVRFANVYGDTLDYPDRVIPAFAKAAATGSNIRIDGPDTCMDFTHTTDVCDGVYKVITILEKGEKNLPPIHFCSGSGTELGELAQIAHIASGNKCKINVVEKRQDSVNCFIGNPSRAKEILDWSHSTNLEVAFGKMVREFKHQQLK